VTRPDNLERRIGRWFALSLLALYGVVATAIWATSRTSARQVAELTLETEAETVGGYIALTGRLDAPEFLAAELEPFPLWLRAFDGEELVAATPGAPDLPWGAPRGTQEVLYLRAPGGREPFLVVRHSLAARAPKHRRATAIEAIGDIEPLRALERRLVFGLLGLGVVIIPLAAWGGRQLARRALAPVGRLVSDIRRLEPDRLERRLEVPARTVEEVELLAGSFNELLARLEMSVAAMRRFTADASHEIRNPLSVMRTGIEVSLRRDRPISEYQRLLRENLDEIERLQSILDGLLALARAEPASAPSEPRESVDFGQLVRETTARFVAAAGERGVELRLELEPGLVVPGDAGLLRLVPFNLLHNALKHGPAGEPIDVEARRVDAAVVLRVTDHGRGIPPAERERIFERYVRLSEDAQGVGGVGLSVVRWVAESHGGRVRVVDSERGARFEVSLPAA
jgi:signal transduction histidine kinase